MSNYFISDSNILITWTLGSVHLHWPMLFVRPCGGLDPESPEDEGSIPIKGETHQ
jgi:hypothetical protein